MDNTIRGLVTSNDICNSVNVKINCKDFTVSIAMDDGITKRNKLVRADLRIFKGERMEDVTGGCFENPDLVIATTENLIKALNYCVENSK